MKDEVRLLREELGELKAGASGLGDQVQLLSQALRAVGDLQRAQREQAETLAAVAQVAETVVPREEHERNERERESQLRAYRRHLVRRIVVGGLLLLAALCALGIFLGAYIGAKADQSFTVCQHQNQAIDAQKDYLRAVTANSTNADLRAAAQRAIGGYVDVNCEDLR